MRFFEEHIHPKHIFTKPHKWFLAFLLSPIHFLERYYQKKYHLNFAHAKKLFAFDIILLLSTLLLFITTILWITYDPTVTKLVYLDIASSQSRMASGEYVEYTINYRNISDVELVSPILSINLPPGFIINDIKPNEDFVDNYFKLKNILPNEQGGFLIGGWIFGTPDEEIPISAALSYRQTSREKFEEKTTAFLKILRGSVLDIGVTSRETVLTKDNLPIEIEVTNTGDTTVSSINIPLPTLDGVSISTNEPWKIESLQPQESRKFSALLTIDTNTQTDTIDLNFTPHITIQNNNIAQSTVIQSLVIAKPNITLDTYWQDNIEFIRPYENAKLIIDIENISNVELVNPKIELPIPSAIVDTDRLAKLNTGNLKNGIFSIPLENLDISDEKQLILDIPITYFPQGGTDILLSLSPRFVSDIKDIPNKKYETTTESPIIKVGTQLLFNPEIRYYTDEGDQLGRGPLPPEVNRETKYWALLNITNGTSKVSNLKLSGKLSPHAVWTGKSSVSHGADVNYNETTKIFAWELNSLSPHQRAGVYFEMSFIPTNGQVGTQPILIEETHISATDLYINKNITKHDINLDISLIKDGIGQAKGNEVK
ncbi:hypothetical protein HN859_01675 [Candidatus Parcubacteria bacterium]|jgi:hypothetical protein|nr:hypothetical protein [Candidatus Parcubacteria bacterium]